MYKMVVLENAKLEATSFHDLLATLALQIQIKKKKKRYTFQTKTSLLEKVLACSFKAEDSSIVAQKDMKDIKANLIKASNQD